MIHRPTHMGSFEFVVVAALRAKQLSRGCVPRVDGGHKAVVTALIEVAEGRISADAAVPMHSREVDGSW
jgi:DNA-directed RNA polymerase subunit K/omega